MNKEHVKNLIKFLHHEVLSSGGDGDALWYSKHYSLDEIKTCFHEYSDDNAVGWSFYKIDDETFNWGDDQEWITVTTSKKILESRPEWQQITITY